MSTAPDKLKSKLMSRWQPTATLTQLQRRAALLQRVRQYFAEQQVMEVETPLLSQFTVTDVHTQSFSVPLGQQHYFLQTSPEYAMKRLLAAGSGCIYQIAKAFRYGEQGGQHNPEFTLLEWYRLGFNHHQLMDDIEALLATIEGFPKAERISYQQLFLTHMSLDIFDCRLSDIVDCLRQHQVQLESECHLDADSALQLLLTHVIEPALGRDAPLFIYDFPVTQAALANIRPGNPPVAERFELYIKGIEIANGFHELTDPEEQQARFQQDQSIRRQQGMVIPEIDNRFIAALHHGLPPCSGVALGLDRLMMLLTQSESIQQVVSFAWDSA